MEQHTFESNPIARQPAVPLQPVIDPAGWTAEEMRSTGDWVYQLSATEIGEIAEAVEGVKKRAIAIIDIRREDFPLPSFGPALDDFRREILHGRGFKTLRGVPVADYTIEQSAIACFGIGTYIGKAVSQNAMGHLLGHVRDLNVDPNSPTKRGYHSSGSLPFHSDSCDVVGLLCLHAAKTGGTSAIVPTVTLHNKLLKRRPDLVEALSQPMYRDRRGEVPEGMTNWYALPYFNYNEGYLTTTKGLLHHLEGKFPRRRRADAETDRGGGSGRRPGAGTPVRHGIPPGRFPVPAQPRDAARADRLRGLARTGTHASSVEIVVVDTR